MKWTALNFLALFFAYSRFGEFAEIDILTDVFIKRENYWNRLNFKENCCCWRCIFSSNWWGNLAYYCAKDFNSCSVSTFAVMISHVLMMHIYCCSRLPLLAAPSGGLLWSKMRYLYFVMTTSVIVLNHYFKWLANILQLKWSVDLKNLKNKLWSIWNAFKESLW